MPATTILLIDDSADTLELLSMYLSSQGYHVLTATDGQTGLRLAFEHQPDLVITDLLIPGMSGFRVVEALKTHPHYRPPVLMMSALDSPARRAYGSIVGANVILHKPFSLHQLRDCIEQLLFAPPSSDTILTDEDHAVEADGLVVS